MFYLPEPPSTHSCAACGHEYWGVGDTCSTCDIAIRHEASKGFIKLCHYLELVVQFEAYLAARTAAQESGDDLAPAVDE